MERMTSEEIHEGMRRALEEVDRRLANGTLDGSGRFFTDEELAGAAAVELLKRSRKLEEPAA
jgi:hypothetical protein